MISRLPLFPSESSVNDRGHLVIGGCDTVDLSAEYRTPLYLFDEASLRGRCQDFREEFGRRYPNTAIMYSCKAFINRALTVLFDEEGLGLEVVSGGELGIVNSVGFPPERIYFTGNNKSSEELRQALEIGISRIVVDNFDELRLLDSICAEMGVNQDVLLRLTPGVDPHTHRYITTGNIDSKFGIPLALGKEAIVEAMSASNLNLLGLHFHIGSQIFEVEPDRESVRKVLELAAGMKREHGFELRELDVGGGFGVRYTLDSVVPAISTFAEVITSTLIDECGRLGIEQPHLVIEPGRSMIARSGVALYTVGVIKNIPGVRRYIAVDGGMGDNIRPALYQARHEAVIAGKMTQHEVDTVTIAGKYCESGDILIWDIVLPPVERGDIIAVPGCGAYCLPEAMNYNVSFKPPIALVREGKARLIRRRETLEDLTRCDLD